LLTESENGGLIKVIDAQKDKMMIKKARWLSENRILLGLLGNDLILFDTDVEGIIRKINISPYTFSDFSLDGNGHFAYTADESGIVHKIDLETFKVVGEYSGVNVDNIYQLVYRNKMVITAGQDRRVGIINTATEYHYFLQKDFLVYSVGLCNDGTIGACCASEENNIAVFSVSNGKTFALLKGHESVVGKMIFSDNNTLISGGDDGNLIVWKIK
jgi:WD40 repeat protein